MQNKYLNIVINGIDSIERLEYLKNSNNLNIKIGVTNINIIGTTKILNNLNDISLKKIENINDILNNFDTSLLLIFDVENVNI